MKKIFTIIALLFLFTNTFAQIDYWQKLPKNKLGIRFGTENIKNQDAELKLSIWYPSITNKLPKLTLQDYLVLGGINADSAEVVLNELINNNGHIFPKDSLKMLLSGRFRATQNARQLKGDFPVLMWSPRHGTVYYQSLFNEFLASNGFVIVCAERANNKLPMAWELDNDNEKKQAFEENLSDLEATFRFVKNKFANRKYGLLSWSYGEEMAVVFCQNHPELKIVLGLSSIRYNAKGIYVGIQKHIDSQRLTVSHTLIFEKYPRRGNPYDSTLLHPKLRPISQLKILPQLAHGNFNFIEGFLTGILNTHHTQGWSKGGEIATNGYLQICERSLEYLNQYFRKDYK